jgi:hypothetical protein
MSVLVNKDSKVIVQGFYRLGLVPRQPNDGTAPTWWAA